MELRTYLKRLGPGEIAQFAERCMTSVGHLRNVAYSMRPCATNLAVRIERESGGEVTRQELRSDWCEHWPELIGANGAPAVEAKA